MTIAGAPAVPPVQPPEAPPAESANRPSPVTGAPATGLAVTGLDDGPAPAAAGPPATPQARMGRLDAPPFSWLGGDAWPHYPAWADKQA